MQCEVVHTAERVRAEAIRLLEVQAQKLQNITAAVFFYQAKSPGQPRFKGRLSRLHLFVGEIASHIAKRLLWPSLQRAIALANADFCLKILPLVVLLPDN